jgi:hypothetical protein
VSIARKTSVVFLEDIVNSRINSGAPGYIKGLPLKTGTLVSDPASTKKPYIIEPKNGFPLIGADNTGKCIKVKQALYDKSKTLEEGFDIENFEDLKYYEDPTLTFDDSVVAGCHLDLTYNELKDFCENQIFNYLAIFQNLYRL